MTKASFPDGVERRWMERALAWGKLAANRGEVPIGAVVVRDGILLGESHDGKEILKEPTAHAEVRALRQAAMKCGDWRLDGADLYVTLEPCAMCAGAIVHARIRRVIFGARNPRWGVLSNNLEIFNNPKFNHQVEVVEGLMADDAAKLLKETFQTYRGANRRTDEGQNSDT